MKTNPKTNPLKPEMQTTTQPPPQTLTPKTISHSKSLFQPFGFGFGWVLGCWCLFVVWVCGGGGRYLCPAPEGLEKACSCNCTTNKVQTTKTNETTNQTLSLTKHTNSPTTNTQNPQRRCPLALTPKRRNGSKTSKNA